MSQATQYKLTESMRQYVLPALLMKDGDKCNNCGVTENSYDIDHIRYADDITIYDLQLLCIDCHRDKTVSSGLMYLTQTTHCSTCTCY